MIEFLLGLLIGGLIAWQVPRPMWATRMIRNIQQWWNSKYE